MNKIDGLFSDVAKDPQNLRLRMELLSELLYDGRVEDATVFLSESLDTLTKTLLLPDRFHKPVIKALRRSSFPSLIEMVVRDIELTWPEEIPTDETLKRMIRSGRKAIVKAEGIYPSSVNAEDWWTPLLIEGDVEVAIPGRVIGDDEEGVHVLMYGHDDFNLLDVESSIMEKDQIEELCPNMPGEILGRHFELGIRPDGSAEIQFHPEEKEK